jgi:hypothetical protein
MFPLSRLNLETATRTTDAPTGFEILEVKRPFCLIQAAGYLKYILGKAPTRAVYFRGQTSLYPQLKPSLYRTISTEAGRKQRDIRLDTFLGKIRRDGTMLRAVSDYAREPLLQHYGYSTRWLDVVDNVWIALWFACFNAYAIGKRKEFLHFEKRSVINEPDGFAYIYLIQSTPPTLGGARPGFTRDVGSETIDLRAACPSHFIRPHAQHGLLVRALSPHNESLLDYRPLLAGIIRVSLDRALQWLGDGHFLTPHALFPPPVYDYGYRELLATPPPEAVALGQIQHIGA